MRILTAIGARPQFVKAAPLSRALRRAGIEEILVHSGQHFDAELSAVFFKELDLPEPRRNLGVAPGTHAQQTAAMLTGFERAIADVAPDLVIVHGDTNTTLAAALAAAKLNLPLAHNEAGLRSFNPAMPEEWNRRIADRVATLRFCPTRSALEQCAREGMGADSHLTGDLQCDALLLFRDAAARRNMLRTLGLEPKRYALLTLHRPYTVDVPARLQAILAALEASPDPVVFPVHPRTRAMLAGPTIRVPGAVRPIDPVGYLDMLALEANARIILTDSGGVQKEAYLHAVPCVTLRPETEWRETVEQGWNRVVDTDAEAIVEAMRVRWWPEKTEPVFGNGHAAENIVEIIQKSAL
jgi:UDP-N-acetylglucosamine 2-epimerase